MKIRKFLIPVIGVLIFGAACCTGNKGKGDKDKNEYIVKGTTSQERLNGKKVYLVPYGDPQLVDSLGVDSVVIENGKFEFRGNKGVFLARVTIDIKHRWGTQDLLVVTEPGEITVVIDSISSGKGTPQNNLLQSWKERKEKNDRIHWNESQHMKYLVELGDTVNAKALADSLERLNNQYVDEIHRLMLNAGKGPAYDFMQQRYGDPSAKK